MPTNRIARFFLKKKLNFSSKRKITEHFNFNDVKSVGIVFSADNALQIETVRKYMDALGNKGKQVKAICFYKAKQLPILSGSSLLIDFVLPKEVNFMGVPGPSFVNGFIENEFDLLIDLDINEVFPVEYVSAMSKAFFKVGKYSKNNELIFDLMIEMDSDKDLNYFMEQINVYLKMINKAA
jgi:hypothetical protein